MGYWLFKSEPNTFSIDDLSARPKQTEHWDGVRNYQARNMLRDAIKVGDLGFFYHSNCSHPGIVGIVKIVKGGYPDSSAWDPSSPYYDAKSTAINPRWYMVDVQLKEKFDRTISLRELKFYPQLKKMQVTRKGNRLSISPVAADEWKFISKLAKKQPI
jgi:predicted RNA-binding protein with PUA-like domain